MLLILGRTKPYASKKSTTRKKYQRETSLPLLWVRNEKPSHSKYSAQHQRRDPFLLPHFLLLFHILAPNYRLFACEVALHSVPCDSVLRDSKTAAKPVRQNAVLDLSHLPRAQKRVEVTLTPCGCHSHPTWQNWSPG